MNSTFYLKWTAQYRRLRWCLSKNTCINPGTSAGVIRSRIGLLALLLSADTSLAASTPGLLISSAWTYDDSAPSRSSHTRENSNSDVTPFSPGSNNLSLDLGQIFLLGDLSKYQNTIGFQLHYNYGVSDIFSFDSSLGYSQHSDGSFSLLSILPGVRMNFSWYDKMIPYGILGLGFYVPSFVDPTASAPQPSASSSQSQSIPSISAVLFGIHVGTGIDLALSKNIFFGTSLMLNQMFGTTKTLASGAPSNVGGAYATFFLHMGTTF